MMSEAVRPKYMHTSFWGRDPWWTVVGWLLLGMIAAYHGWRGTNGH